MWPLSGGCISTRVYGEEFCVGVGGRSSLDGANVDVAVLAPPDGADSEIPHLPVDSKEELGVRPSLLLWLVPGVTGGGTDA